ncbi:GFA family protein [Chloroflexi bacterium TSY]|nr:GFA family protein [Chloroflexi bacterium TSY]
MNNKITISLPLRGGCQCRAIKYEVTKIPLTLYVCHCTECQRQSSSGFGMSMPVSRDGFTVTQGETQLWSRPAASGRTVNCHFCPHCGTRLFHAPSRNDAVVNVKPGTLDVTDWLKPVGHLWTQSAQSWVTIPSTALLFERQPADFAPLYDAWQAQIKE